MRYTHAFKQWFTDEELAAGDAWLHRYGHKLPHPDAGRDDHVVRYKFLPTAADELDERLDDRDGADFADETFQADTTGQPQSLKELDEEKIAAYLGLESTLDKVTDTGYLSSSTSSGSLKSTWLRVEKMLGSFYYGGGDGLSPTQWLELENSENKKPRKKQYRGPRENPMLRKVWDSVNQELIEKHIKKFCPTRVTTRMAWDETIREFREVPFTEFNPYDDHGLEQERRVMEKKSPRRVASLPDGNEMAPAMPVTFPVGPMREFNGDRSDPRFQEWLRVRDYEALLRFRAKITQAS